MRRVLAGCLMGIAVLLIAAAASANGTHLVKVKVDPKIGIPTTRFVVSFRLPARSGAAGALVRRYELNYSGQGSGCGQGGIAVVPPGNKGQRVSIRLGGRWCVATYHGRITETERPNCAPDRACPDFIIEVGTVGRFSFTVSAPAPA